MELPFAGVMVLLTIPGKAAKRPAETLPVNQLPLDFKFSRIVRQLKATASGLQETAPDEFPGKYFSGIIRYEAQVDMPQDVTAELVLPEALRAMCAVEINGKMEKLNWAPYIWKLSMPAGKSTIALEISTTAHGALNEPSYRQ